MRKAGSTGKPAKARARAAGEGASLAAGGPGWHANAQFYPLAGRAVRAAGHPADAAAAHLPVVARRTPQISNLYYVFGGQFVRRPISRPGGHS
ncbi:hypothetical protein OH687_30745 [Burkholderia anthina]|nr:hypothetical protein OH687_30745 [Burkholderia anthina]